jgi:hypothetical protein
MARRQLAAHVFVACRSVQWDGPAGPNTSRTLEQVSYVYRTEVPGGFPYETELWLFLRISHDSRTEFGRELRLSLIWHDDPQMRKEVWSRQFLFANFRPSVTVKDIAASVSAIFEGPGRYEFRLWYPVVRKWDQAKQRKTLARAHVRIEG